MNRKEEAKKIDLVSYLGSVGHQPTKKSKLRYWYLSPFRNENQPSFVVELGRNTWNDFGLRERGDILDFVMKHDSCTFSQAIDKILGDEVRVKNHNPYEHPVQESGIDVIDVMDVKDKYLIDYGKSRAIEPDLLREHCSEVHFVFKGWEHIVNKAIGFKNLKEGWELRSPSKKVGTSPKYWSMVRGFGGELNSCDVFEGFFDFLSYLQFMGWNTPKYDAFVLNSTVFAEWVKPELETYSSCGLYLDNDAAAERVIQEVFNDGIYIDARESYASFNDYNDFVKSELLNK